MFDRCDKLDSPAVIYDYDSLINVINSIKENIGTIKKSKLYVSMKANRNLLLNKYMACLVDGTDVSSYEEFKIAKAAGYRFISATSPGIQIEHINEMILNNVRFDFDNLDQLSSYAKKYKYKKEATEIGIRLNIPLESNYSTTFLSNSRFGMNLSNFENKQKLKELMTEYNLKVISLHIHIGELNNFETVKNVLDYLLELIPLFKDLKSLNLGGGFTRLYANQQEALKVFQFIQSFIDNNLPDLDEVIFEPGMLIYVMTGYLKTSVLSVNNNIINMDTSAWNLIEWTKNNINLIYSNSRKELSNQKIVGNTCYEKDIFFENINSNKLEVNDFILLFPFGAYTISMSKSLHGIGLPKEYLYIENNFIELSDAEVKHNVK